MLIWNIQPELAGLPKHLKHELGLDHRENRERKGGAHQEGL